MGGASSEACGREFIMKKLPSHMRVTRDLALAKKCASSETILSADGILAKDAGDAVALNIVQIPVRFVNVG